MQNYGGEIRRAKRARGVDRMKIIGITGGVGAGKSAILKFLEAEYGGRVIEADLVGHLVMEPGTAGYQAILEQFGSEILDVDGRIDRKALGGIVFADPEKLQILNGIIHPAVKNWIRTEIEKEQAAGDRQLLIIEAALLIEDHYEELCEEFWYIYTEPEIRRARLKETRGYTDEKITAILGNQLSDELFRTHCQKVINNNGSKEEAYSQIRELMEKGE